MNPTLKTPEKVLALLSLMIVLSSGAVAVAVENKVQEVVATEQVATRLEVRPVVQVVEPVKKTKPLSYFENKTSLTDIELVWLLEAVGFEGQELKEAWAIAKKESNGRPLAFNGNTLTGDNSYGIFQINMINTLGEDRREKFDLDHNADLFNPVKNAEIAFHMSQGGDVWRAWHIGKDAYTSTSGSHYAKFKQWLGKFPTEKKLEQIR
jgi:hypothetical protein